MEKRSVLFFFLNLKEGCFKPMPHSFFKFPIKFIQSALNSKSLTQIIMWCVHDR